MAGMIEADACINIIADVFARFTMHLACVILFITMIARISVPIITGIPVSMIAAIALTLRKRKDAKTPNITGQINARAQDRLTLVSMPATQAAATAKTQGEETK